MDEWDEYVKITDETAVYPGAKTTDDDSLDYITEPFMYVTLGLCGEAGEVADVVKKQYRQTGYISQYENEFKQKVKEELGDVCWYIARICRELDLTMTDVLETNVLKLKTRKEKDELKVHD